MNRNLKIAESMLELIGEIPLVRLNRIYSIADWIAQANPGSTVLTIFPDHGIRYMRTVYNAEWLNARAEELQRMWAQPVLVDSPTKVGRDWACFTWGRRSYPEVLGHGPVSR